MLVSDFRPLDPGPLPVGLTFADAAVSDAVVARTRSAAGSPAAAAQTSIVGVVVARQDRWHGSAAWPAANYGTAVMCLQYR